MQENMSSGFPTKEDTKQSPQLQSSQKTEISFVASLDMILLKKANNKGADQTVRMCRLVCAFVVRNPPKTGFLASRPIYMH